MGYKTQIEELVSAYWNSGKQEDYDTAKKACEDEINSGDYSRDDLLQYAQLQDCYAGNITKNTISLYNRIIDESRDNKDQAYYNANCQLIMLLARNNRSHESIDKYKKMIREEPEDYHSYSFLSKAYFWAKQYDDAWLALEAALKHAPENAVLLSDAGYVVKALGRYDEAIEFFDKSYAMDYSNASTLYGKACLYMDTGRYAESIKAWEEVNKWCTLHGFPEDEWAHREIERMRKLL